MDDKEMEGMIRFSPRETIEAIIRRGDTGARGLRPYIEALAYARWQKWERLELEQYVKLGVLLSLRNTELDEDVADRLAKEITHTHIVDDVEVVLRVLTTMLGLVPVDDPTLRTLIDAFERRAEDPLTAWRTRAQIGGFLDRLRERSAGAAEEERRRFTARLADWALDYHTDDALAGFDRRSRGMFVALLAADWARDPDGNVASGLDGSFNCAVDKLMQADRLDWFEPFVRMLSEELTGYQMFRRLSGETLFEVTGTLAATRRRIHERGPRAATAVTALEDAIHRPHRVQLDRTPMRLELELPGPRGFNEGTRLRVFDLSRDGCLVVTDEAAQFDQTGAAETFQLDRGPGRLYEPRRLTGVIRRETGVVEVHPGTEILLHNVAEDDREWAAIDRASVVRFSSEHDTGRLWLAFHFDHMVPEVKQELENLVTQAA